MSSPEYDAEFVRWLRRKAKDRSNVYERIALAAYEGRGVRLDALECKWMATADDAVSQVLLSRFEDEHDTQ